jgi:phosphatidylglycerophosphate synthase
MLSRMPNSTMPNPTVFSLDDVRAVCKRRDAWWTVLLVDPVAIRLTRVLASRTSITPSQITIVAFLLGIGAAGCFLQGTAGWLIAGAALYHVGFILDCCDGKIARLKGLGTPFGGWLDFMLDRVRDAICAVALGFGMFWETGNAAYLGMACAILALDMFRYLNGSQMHKARRAMRASAQTVPVNEEAEEAAEDADAGAAAEAAETAKVQAAQAAGGASGSGPRAFYLRVRAVLLRRRIRMHLVSGIEFQMFAFIVGPVTGLILPMVAVTGGLLLAFELVLIFRFTMAARHYVPPVDGAPFPPDATAASTPARV